MSIIPQYKIGNCVCGCNGKGVAGRKVGKEFYCLNSYNTNRKRIYIQKANEKSKIRTLSSLNSKEVKTPVHIKRTKFKVGEKYGMLTIISIAGRDSDFNYWAECLCDCGVIKNIRTASLRCGATRSCGCLASDMKIGINTTHKKTNTKEYRCWASMKTRCGSDESTSYYKNYTGRGIGICDRWIDSFENFYEDMGDIPVGKRSLGRIDNDKGYSPENCRWEDSVEQARNTRTNLFIEYNGVTKTLEEWAIETGIPKETLSVRYRRNLPIEDVFSIERYKPKVPALLRRWFKEKQPKMSGKCSHCGGKSCTDDKYYKCSIAHILPKAYFPSVATHPDNWIELCFWGNNCHGNMDNKMLDLIDMNCFSEIVDKFVKMYPSIAPEERRRIPPILIEYLKTEI